MKRCDYCGKQYLDDLAECSVDGMALVTEESPVPPLIGIQPVSSTSAVPSAVSNNSDDRWLRIFEISLVCTISVGTSLLVAIYSLFGQRSNIVGGSLRWSYGIVHELAALGLLGYVLLRRSRSFRDLGLRPRWTDIGWSFGLCFAGSLVAHEIYQAIYYAGLTPATHDETVAHVTQYLFGGGVFLGTLIFQCVNPFFEELIVRAYVITEVKQLTGKVWIAVALATLLQTSYHLYQGVPMTLAIGGEFLVWSIYYAKTNRITPIILAHLYQDVGSTLFYVFRH